MSTRLINELVKAAGAGAEVCGGRVVALVDGVKTVLGGPLNESNTFELTDAGRAVLEAKKPKAKKAKEAKETEGQETEGQEASSPDGLGGLDLDAE